MIQFCKRLYLPSNAPIHHQKLSQPRQMLRIFFIPILKKNYKLVKKIHQTIAELQYETVVYDFLLEPKPIGHSFPVIL